MDFNFFMPTHVVSGRGCLESGQALLKALGTRCLIITGASSAKASGAITAAEKVLREAGIDYLVYDKIAPNPLLSSCFEAGTCARKFRADFILGIGGGSPLDSAKAAAVFAANPSISAEDIFKGAFTKALPIVLVGTTAGTGSEVTATAVLTVDGKGVKKSITHKCCYASLAFADPAYTESCPYNLTVTAALDALCHAVEGYYAKRAGDIAQLSAIKALHLLWPNLLSLRDRPGELPDAAAREELYYGSLWAGITLNLCGTGFPHPAGYPLSIDLDIPHGKACSIFLPAFVRHNAPAAKERTVRLFAALGCGLEPFCETVERLTAVRGVKLSPEKCTEYARQLEGRKNLVNTVSPSTVDDILLLYNRLFG